MFVVQLYGGVTHSSREKVDCRLTKSLYYSGLNYFPGHKISFALAGSVLEDGYFTSLIDMRIARRLIP